MNHCYFTLKYFPCQHTVNKVISTGLCRTGGRSGRQGEFIWLDIWFKKGDEVTGQSSRVLKWFSQTLNVLFTWKAQTGSFCCSTLCKPLVFVCFWTILYVFYVAFFVTLCLTVTHSKHRPATARRLKGTSQRWALPLSVLLIFGFLVLKSRNGRRTMDDLKCTIKPGRKRRKLVFLTATSNIKYREEIFENYQYSKRNWKSIHIKKCKRCYWGFFCVERGN